MGTPHNESNHVSHPPSVTSEEDDLRGTGVQVSPHVSPQYSERGGQSRTGSSELREEYIHLTYPSEEVDPSDSASRLDALHRPPVGASRSSSSRRDLPRPRTGPREAGLHQPREPPGETESVADSTEDFIRRPYPHPAAMPRPQSYYDNNGYTHSSSSGSYVYAHPQITAPPGGQIVHYASQQMPVQYAPQYHQMGSPPPMYTPSHHGYPISHHPGSHVSSPYTTSPFGPPPPMMGYPGPLPGYFGPQYPQQYPHPQYMDQMRVYSPAPTQVVSPPPSAAPTTDAEKPKVDPDDIAKRIEAIMLAQSERESEARLKRDEVEALAKKAAADDAAAKADRAAAEQRIRQEAHDSAIKAAADAAAAAAERAAREQSIREEAAAAALKAAAEEAAARAERAAKDAKIADEAAAAARTEAEKKAAEEAAKNKEESEKKQKEAQEKLEEAEKAAAKAKAEAEEANKKAEAAAPPPERKAPIRFHDAVGRKFNFPFELCTRWRGMESLINQAFQHVEVIGEHVQNGHYDLVGPTGEIILPGLWEAIIEPDWVITMHMWPMPEKKEEEMPMIPPPPDGLGVMLNMDEILNGKKGPPSKSDKRGGQKRSKSRPGAFSSWMLGGSSAKAKSSLKGDKKPDLAAGSQHGAADHGACIVM